LEENKIQIAEKSQEIPKIVLEQPKNTEENKDPIFITPSQPIVRQSSYGILFPPPQGASPIEQAGGERESPDDFFRSTPRRNHVELNMYVIEHTYIPYSPTNEIVPANAQPIIPLISLTTDQRPEFNVDGFPAGSPLVMPTSCLHLASTPTLLSSFSNALNAAGNRQNNNATPQQPIEDGTMNKQMVNGQ